MIALSVCVLPFSQVLAGLTTGEGGLAGEFLRYGADVRSLGMGRAYVSLADDASALYYNPAGLMRLPRRFSFYGMNFKPFYESRYNFISLAVNRPSNDGTGLKKILFGANSAWGFAVVHFGSDGYEQRDARDNLIDDNISLYQQAFLLGYAREYSGSAGILGYGITFKLLRQGLSGNIGKSTSAFGLDIGAQWQMINPPIIKGLTRVPLIGPFFDLKHLLPLRMGISIRNLVQPRLGFGGEKDKLPASLRIGASYQLSTNWLIRKSQLILVSDFEWLYNDIQRLIKLDRRVEVHEIGPGAGQYFGIEYQYRNNTNKFQLAPRFGISNVFDQWKISTGIGLVYKTDNYDFQFDFAHGFHENLADDQRFSLTIRFGGKRDAGYFAGQNKIYGDGKLSERQPFNNPCSSTDWFALADSATAPDSISDSLNQSERGKYTRMLATYPDEPSAGKQAAIILARNLDKQNDDRYYPLVGGSLLAISYAENAEQAFQKGDHTEARILASKAISEFEKIAENSTKNPGDLFDALKAQCEMITAATSRGNSAEKAWDRAIELLEPTLQENNCLKPHFLIATCYQQKGDYVNAAAQFQKALSGETDDPQGMLTLARLWLGDALIRINRPDSARKVLQPLVTNLKRPVRQIDPDYPRFWSFGDMRIPDDAQYLIAQSRLGIDNDKAVEEFLKVCRFFPGSERCEAADRLADSLLQNMINR